MDLPALWNRFLAQHPVVALTAGAILAMAAAGGALTFLQEYLIPGTALVVILLSPSDWAAVAVISVSLVLLVLLIRAVGKAHSVDGDTMPPVDAIPWRRGDAMLRRYDHLSVDFSSPRPGVYRTPEEWDARLQLFEDAFGRLELAVEDAPFPHYDEYVAICREIREILGQAVQKPKGKWYYLALSESGVTKRLRDLVERDRDAELQAGEANGPKVVP